MVESAASWFVAACGVLLTCLGVPILIRYGVGTKVLNISIALMLARYMRMPTSTVAGRILNASPVMWIGAISYSLYVWQQPWMFTTRPVVFRIVGAMACAALSYYLVERPVLRLRRRLSRALAARAWIATAGAA